MNTNGKYYKRLVFLWVVFLRLAAPLAAQNQLNLNYDSLSFSFEKIKTAVSQDTIEKRYQFLTDDDFEFAYSNSFIHLFKRILNKIALPISPDSLDRISIIRCYYSTDAYSLWFITLINTSEEHFVYYYEDNSGASKAEFVGKTEGNDFIKREADHLFNVRETKSEDYMVVAEIEGNTFKSLKATQTFHFLDIVFFLDLLELIKAKNCK